MLSNQQQLLVQNESSVQGAANAVQAMDHPDSHSSGSTNLVPNPQGLEGTDQVQIPHVPSNGDKFTSLSELIMMKRKIREEHRIPQLQLEEKHHELKSPVRLVPDNSSNIIALNGPSDSHHVEGTHRNLRCSRSGSQVIHENFMALRHEHECEDQAVYEFKMMKETIKMHCKRFKDDQAKIAYLEQQVKTMSLNKEDNDRLQCLMAHKRVENEVKIAQLEEQVKTLALENESLREMKRDPSFKCFELDGQNRIVKCNHKTGIEDEDNHMAIPQSQRDCEPGTASDSEDSMSQIHNLTPPNSEAGDDVAESDRANSYELINPALSNSKSGDNMTGDASDDEDFSFGIINRSLPNSEAGETAPQSKWPRE